jgi:TatA/E family protein of Tat protein translocase
MFDVGGGELLLIVLAVIVLFGPQKLPEIAQMFGKGLRKVREAQSQFTKQMNTIKSEINSNIEGSTGSNYDFYDQQKAAIRDNPPIIIESTSGINVESSDTSSEEPIPTDDNNQDKEIASTQKNYQQSDPYGINDKPPAG